VIEGTGAYVMMRSAWSDTNNSQVNVSVLVDILSNRMLPILIITGTVVFQLRPFIATRTGSFNQFLLPLSATLWMDSIDFDTGD
jgi:hypothetical protein